MEEEVTLSILTTHMSNHLALNCFSQFLTVILTIVTIVTLEMLSLSLNRVEYNFRMKSSNKTSPLLCWNLAQILDIEYTNKLWQVLQLPGTTIYLYAAYFDTRKDSLSLK